MRSWVFILILGIAGCGGNVFGCEEGKHRSGSGCADDRVLGQPDSGDAEDTGA